jgi:hypothetical protein
MFDCMLDVCPQSSEKCHLWWEVPEENTETGEIRIKKGCILSQYMGLPIVQSIVRAAHVSSEHASKARNSFDSGFERLNRLAEQSLAMRQQEGLE